MVIDRETQLAKTLLAAGRKPQALLALRKKKYQQNLLEKSQAQLDNVQSLVRHVPCYVAPRTRMRRVRHALSDHPAPSATIGGTPATCDCSSSPPLHANAFLLHTCNCFL